jgi:hypothetical protein
MTAEIEPRRVSPIVVDPMAGEVVDLAVASTDRIADFLVNVRELESQLREQKNLAQREILARMDREAAWTARVGDWVLTAPSPNPRIVYDAETLEAVLAELVESDLIAPNAASAAVERVVVLKVHKNAVNKLLKLGGAVKARIDALAVEEAPERKVSVKRRTDS